MAILLPSGGVILVSGWILLSAMNLLSYSKEQPMSAEKANYEPTLGLQRPMHMMDSVAYGMAGEPLVEFLE